jgi:hypothetical protein
LLDNLSTYKCLDLRATLNLTCLNTQLAVLRTVVYRLIFVK